MHAPKYSITSVIVRDCLGTPRAFAVVGIRSRGLLTDVKIILTMEERVALNRAVKACRHPGGKDGVARCAVYKIQDKRHEGRPEAYVEKLKYFSSTETLALDVCSIIEMLPEQLVDGDLHNIKPLQGLTWGDVVLIRAVLAAHNLTLAKPA